MLKDALEFIFGQAEESANPKPNIRQVGPRRRVVTLNGVASEEVVDPFPLARTAETLESVALLSNQFGGKNVTAFVNQAGITVILDDADRNETVVMGFTESDQFQALLDLKAGKKQRDLVKILRTVLAGAVANDQFLQIVRQVEFDLHRGSRGEVSHQKETLGRSVEKAVRANAGEVPETLRVTVPLFSVPHDLPTNISLECAVTVDMDSETIAIEPTGDSLVRETKKVLEEIVERLRMAMPEDALVVEGSVADVVPAGGRYA